MDDWEELKLRGFIEKPDGFGTIARKGYAVVPPQEPDSSAGQPPAEIALRAEIAAHAAAGREAEREAAADRLAAAIMKRTLPRRDAP